MTKDEQRREWIKNATPEQLEAMGLGRPRGGGQVKFRGQPLNIHEHELALAAAGQVARWVESECRRLMIDKGVSDEEAEAIAVLSDVLADGIRAGEWVSEDEEAGDVGCFEAST